MITNILYKVRKNIALVTVLTLGISAGCGTLASCSSLEDDSHYSDSNTAINNEQLKIVDMTSEAYLKSRSDLSSMSTLFEQQGIYDELNQKGQLSTILAVTNDNFKQPSGDADDVAFVTKSHVSDISMSPANLSNGERIMMWHGKYVSVDIDSLGIADGLIANHIMFNNSAVKEVVKTNSGYIYIISNMIETPTSLYDYLSNLDDNYSLFREMVLSSGGKEFDKANSKAVGINDEGNTVYDSVFIYKNTYFEDKGFDMNSESLTATVLVFTNDVINEAIADAHQRLTTWGIESNGQIYRETRDFNANGILQGWRSYATRAEMDEIIKQWILDVAFFNKSYTADDLQNSQENYLTSIFSRYWRTDKQEIDKQNPISLSNATAYKVTKLHIPNNVLIYRLKENFYLYEYCTDEQKNSFFIMNNMKFSKCSTEVTAWTPLSGVWPEWENRVLILAPGDDDTDKTGSWQLTFTPNVRYTNEDGTSSVKAFLIPPGTYRLAMGFTQNQNLDIEVSVMAKGSNSPLATSGTITLGSATTYHYDRGATLDNRYPEGYDTNAEGVSSNKKAGNYMTDGGLICESVTVPDINGNGTPVQVTFNIVCPSWATKTQMKFNHWCLRPTKENY